MGRSIRIFRLLEQVFEAYRMMFKELKEKRSSCHHKAFAKKRKTPQNTKTLLGCVCVGGVNNWRIFDFCGWYWSIIAAKSEGLVYM